MKKRLAIAVVTAALAGCANFDLITRPPGGYDALRLNRQVSVPLGALRGEVTFPAGALLVADRRSKDGRDLYYCGLGIMNSGPVYSMCVTYDRRSLAITFPMTGERYETPITSDDVAETKN